MRDWTAKYAVAEMRRWGVEFVRSDGARYLQSPGITDGNRWADAIEAELKVKDAAIEALVRVRDAKDAEIERLRSKILVAEKHKDGVRVGSLCKCGHVMHLPASHCSECGAAI